MKFQLMLENYSSHIGEIEFDVISDDDRIRHIVQDQFEEIFKYDLFHLWREPYAPITFNMIIESEIINGEKYVEIYSDGVE